MRPTRPQYQLDVAAQRPDYSRKSYILTESTRETLRVADKWLKSDGDALAICGPPGSGKSHLAHLIAAEASTRVLDASSVPDAAPGSVIVVDDVQRSEPPQLLQGIERIRERGGRLVLVGEGRPAEWAGGLRDLETRLEAMARIELGEPDEDLLKAVIARQFRVRQWRASAAVPEYAAPRIPKTFAAARAFVEAAGAEAIANGRPINLALARKVVDNLSAA